MTAKFNVVQGTLSIGRGEEETTVGSPRWFTWLRDALVFHYQGGNATFTARKQPRRGTMYWYAYTRQAGALRCIYIGRTEDLTAERLNAVAARLAANVKAQTKTITAEIMGGNARAAHQTAMQLEQLWAEQGDLNFAVAQQRLEELQLLVHQNHRLTGQAACFTLDLIAVLLEALRTTNESVANERERLYQENRQLRAALPMTDWSQRNGSTHGEVF